MTVKEELLKAYLLRENSEQALADLEKRKAASPIDQSEYSALQERHNEAIEQAKKTLKAIRTKLRKELNSRNRELEELNGSLSLLFSRLKAGELTGTEHGEQAGPLKKEIASVESQVAELELLLDSTSSADLSGKVAAVVSPAEAGKPAPKTATPVVNEAVSLEKAAPVGKKAGGNILQRHPVFSAVAVICIVALAVVGLSATREPAIICPAVGGPAPEFTLTSTEGKKISLGDFKGKVVMLYFWNFDCSPCDRDIWNIMAVYEKWSKRDFVVLAVNEKDSLAAASEYAANRKMPFPVLMDSDGAVRKKFCLDQGLPASVLIDADGMVSTLKTGAFEGSGPLEQLVSALVVKKGIDIEPPIISNIAVPGITDESATITWVTNEPATTQVTVVAPADFQSPKAVTDLTRNHSVTLNGLKPSTGYQFKVIAADGSGNESVRDEKTQLFTTPASQPVGPQVGKQAPDFTLQLLDGKPVTLSALKGKVVLVNFWRRSCSDCLRELPHIQEIFDQKLGDQFVILAIHEPLDSNGLKEFVARFKITFPVLIDTQGSTLTSYRVQRIPSSYFIDGKGIVRQVLEGPFTSLDQIENTVKQLLKNP